MRVSGVGVWSQEFQDALLDLLQPIVVFVQDLFGAVDIADFLGPFLPRHRRAASPDNCG